MTRRVRLGLTAAAALSSYFLATVPNQPHWAIGVEGAVVAVAAALGIRTHPKE